MHEGTTALQPHAEAFGANVDAATLAALLARFPTTARGRQVAAARAGAAGPGLSATRAG